MKAASIGLAQVIASALAASVGEAVGNLGGPAPDWIKLVRNCMIDLKWETPPGTPAATVNGFATTATQDALGGIGFSIGISGTF